MTLFDGIGKVCAECGVDKPASKYHKHPQMPDGLMPVCKACRIGCTALNERRREAMLERQWGDPTEEQIRLACERLRGGWSKAKLARRTVKNPRRIVS
jgi:hypothetical protein